MNKDIIKNNSLSFADDYNILIDNISTLWANVKEKAVSAINTELLEANWQTGKYIVEFEQGGKALYEKVLSLIPKT